MHRRDAGIGETTGDLAQAAKTFFRHLVVAVTPRVAHDPDQFRAEPLHTRNGAVDLRQRNVERVVHLLAPVGDCRAEAIDRYARLAKFRAGAIEGVVRHVVNVLAVDTTRFDGIPAKRFCRFDLPLQPLCRFIGEPGQIHLADLHFFATFGA